MSRRSSTLQSDTAVATIRELDSRYDVIKQVSEHLDEIALILDIDVDALLLELQDAQDFTGITVVTGPSAAWDPVNKIITVPTVKGDTGDTGPAGVEGPAGPQGIRGPTGATGASGSNGVDGLSGSNGVDGLNGMVPILQFSIDVDGDLAYEVIGYEEGPTVGERFPVEEW